MPGPGFDLIGEAEIENVLEVLRGGWIYRYGQDDNPHFRAQVWNFEKAMAQLTRANFAVAVNSGSTALWLSLLALGIGAGDEVIVPGFTFIASISSIAYAGAIPVLAEIDRTFNLDPRDVAQKITPRTRAIMPVHLMGNPARMDEIKTIADQHNLFLLEDCAQAFGASYHNKPVGSIGNIGAFSFNYAKIITAGEGGVITTNDEELYKRAFALHDQGHAPLRKGREIGQRPFLGLDFRMTELQGAVLLAQLKRLEMIRARCHANKKIFYDALRDIPNLEFREVADEQGEAATVLTVLFPNAELAENITRALHAKRLSESGWHVYSNMEPLLQQRMPVPQASPFTNADVNYYAGMLPQTDALLARAFNIGLGMTDKALATWGVDIRSSDEEVKNKAEEIRRIALEFLQ